MDLRFVQHVAVTTLNFDDIEFTGYYTIPAELPVEILADRAETAANQDNSPSVWLWPVSPGHEIHAGLESLDWTHEFHGCPGKPRSSR